MFVKGDDLPVPKRLGELLAMLSKLNKLDLSDNPWKEPPEAVVEKGALAASEYFADLFAEGVTDRRNIIKAVLVGQEGAGKTRQVLLRADFFSEKNHRFRERSLAVKSNVTVVKQVTRKLETTHFLEPNVCDAKNHPIRHLT